MSASPRAQLALAAVAMGAAAMLLAYFPPEIYAFYPSCPLHDWLGLQCPGCGLTRALADLVAGRVGEAARHNVLAVVLAPAALGFCWLQSYSVWRWNRWQPVRVPRTWVAASCTAVALFGLGRNFGFGF